MANENNNPTTPKTSAATTPNTPLSTGVQATVSSNVPASSAPFGTGATSSMPVDKTVKSGVIPQGSDALKKLETETETETELTDAERLEQAKVALLLDHKSETVEIGEDKKEIVGRVNASVREADNFDKEGRVTNEAIAEVAQMQRLALLGKTPAPVFAPQSERERTKDAGSSPLAELKNLLDDVNISDTEAETDKSTKEIEKSDISDKPKPT